MTGGWPSLKVEGFAPEKNCGWKMNFQVTAVKLWGCTLPETNRAPENGWLVQMNFPFWGRLGLFSGAVFLLLVSGRVGGFIHIFNSYRFSWGSKIFD